MLHELTPPVACIQTATETEQQLIDRCLTADSDAFWTIGLAALQWTEQFARGRTDRDFAELIGTNQQRVNEARRVATRFYRISGNCPGLRKSHYLTALQWSDDDALDCLTWASEQDQTVEGMCRYHRATYGGESSAVRSDDHVDDAQNTTSHAISSATDTDPAELIQRGDKPYTPLGISPEDLDRDRTREAPEKRSASDNVLRLRAARKLYRAAAELCELGCDEGVRHLAREIAIEAQQGTLELPDDRTLAALLQL